MWSFSFLQHLYSQIVKIVEATLTILLSNEKKKNEKFHRAMAPPKTTLGQNWRLQEIKTWSSQAILVKGPSHREKRVPHLAHQVYRKHIRWRLRHDRWH